MPTLKPMPLVCTLALAVAACELTLGATAAATVNGEDIPARDVDRRYEAVAETPGFEQQLQMTGGAQALEAQVKAEQLDALIDAELLRQGAVEMELEVTEEDLERERERVGWIYQELGQDLDELAAEGDLDEEALDAALEELAHRVAVGRELVARQERDRDDLSPSRERWLSVEAVEDWLAEQRRAADVVVDEPYGQWDDEEERVVPAERPAGAQEEARQLTEDEVETLEQRLQQLQEEETP